MRLIEIDDVIKKLNDAERRMDMRGFYRISVEIRSICSAIKRLPTIDAVQVVRGEWKLYGNDDDSGMSYWCTACNFQLSEDLFYSGYKNGRWIENGVFKYCPNCGAKMDKEG